MGKRIVKNYPSPRLMETIGATNQSHAEAIGELVANCFDARYQDEKLIINIYLRNKRIIVIDNGKGMSSNILEKAVCIGEDMSQYLQRGDGAKGHFGMGFKTSCSTLGGDYEIYTRPAGEDIEYHTSFNISEYGKRPSGSDAWDVEIEDKTRFVESPLGEKAQHGTAFVIKELRNSDIMVSSVLDYLGEAFKYHLQQGDKIVIFDDNGCYDAVPKKYEFVKGSRIEIDESCGPNNKYRITGWMAIDEQTHNNGIYGFNIYRHGQMVVQNEKSWFRAHLMTSRIIGEVNMDFLDATFFKQGVQKSAEDWQIVSAHMREYLKGVVRASTDLSKKGNIHIPTEKKKIINRLHKDYGIAGGDEGGDDDFDEKKKKGENEKGSKPKNTSITDTIKEIVTEHALVLENDITIDITYLVRSCGGNVKSPFDYIYSENEEDDDKEDEKAELQVILYADHPIWEKKCDDELKRIFATSDAIYRVLVEKLQYDTSKATKIRNVWLLKRMEGGN